MTTPTQKIGNSEVSAIGFGTWVYNAVESDEERFKLLDRAYELGCRHWDTADMYHDSEKLLGRWFRRTGKRSDIFLATKFGFLSIDDLRVRGDAQYVKEVAERSLRRFGVDHIDLYYLHRVDKDTPIEETVGAMAELVNEGKVKHLGLSECSSSTLRRAHAVHPIAAVQLEYSPFVLDIEDPKIALLETARELGVKVVAYSPLGRGLLTGQYKSVDDLEDGDWRKTIPMYMENFSKILGISEKLREIGLRHDASASQVALAWLLAQGEDIIPIPGTRRIKNLEDNLAAAKVKLNAEEIQEVRKAIAAAGLDRASGRYPPGMAEQLLIDSPPLRK